MKPIGWCAMAFAVLLAFSACETYTGADTGYSTREQQDAGTPGERAVGPATDRAGAQWGGW